MRELDRIVKRNPGISAIRARRRVRQLNVSSRTVRRYLRHLGWRTIRTKYCQFVSNKNRYERFIYSMICMRTHERFLNFIFCDECTVHLVRHGSFYRAKEAPNQMRLVGRYSHEASVHIIGAISRRGRTQLIIFTNNLNSRGLQALCDQFLLPFIGQMYPYHHRLYLDGAGHHTSYDTRAYFRNSNVNLAVHPAQSPDFNPIKLVWNDLKYYLKQKIKPNNVEELVLGINRFWETKVTVEYCNSKIDHLDTVLKRAIVLRGMATGI